MIRVILCFSYCLVVASGAGIGDLAKGVGTVQTLTGGAATDCVAPKQDCDMGFGDIAGNLQGGGLTDAATKLIGTGAGRRRRQAAVNSLMGPFAGSNNMFTDQLAGKMQSCDERTDPKGDLAQMKPDVSLLAKGQLPGLPTDLSQPGKALGDQCQKAMKTDEQNCEMLRQNMCAVMNGQLKNPNQFKCAMKDVVQKQAQIKAKNDACDTASQVINNPNNAGSILTKGGQNVGTSLVAGKVAGDLIGRR